MARAERSVFAHSLPSSFAPKLHALVVVGQSPGPLLGCDVRWWAGEEAAVLHGNRPLVCMHEVMGLAGYQKEAECEGGRAQDTPWLIVLPRESPGRPVLSH